MEFEGIKIKVPVGWREILVASYPEGLYESDEMLIKSNEINKDTIMDTQRSYKNYTQPYTNMLHSIKGKKVYLFGAGDSLRIWLERYGENLHVVCTFDNAPNKWETGAYGILVKNPSELPQLLTSNDRLIITSIYHKEIIQQLKNMGINDYYVFIDGLNYQRNKQ